MEVFNQTNINDNNNNNNNNENNNNNKKKELKSENGLPHV